jgi:hypothetical protein
VRPYSRININKESITMKMFYALLIALALPLAAATTSWAQCDCGAAGGGCDAGCDKACGCHNRGCHNGGCDNGGCCNNGGCDNGCCKVCKLVKVEKEVKATCYGVKCKGISVPGCGSGCTDVACVHCGGKGCKSCCGCDHSAHCKVRFPVGKPGCSAKVKTVRHLVKYETKKKICTYEWKVVSSCNGDCDGACGDNGCHAGCDAGNGNDAGCDAGNGDGNGNGDSVPMPPTPAAGV